MRFGIFYEHQLPRPWDDGRRGEAPERRARAGRAGRQGRDRLRLGGRAPLPRGVLALERARGVPRRREPADEEHPARPRHRADPAATSTTPRGSPSGSPRSTCLGRPGRLRHRRGELAGRARRRSGSTATRSTQQWEEGLDAITRMFVEEPFAGYDGQLDLDAAAQRRAEADAEAAPAAVGGVQPPRDDPRRRPEGARRADVRVRRARRGEAVGRRVLRPDHRRSSACRAASR